MDDYNSMNSFFQGFMVDQRARGNAKPAVANGVSKKGLFAGTLAGTNGLRIDVHGDGGGETVSAGNDAAQGVGAM